MTLRPALCRMSERLAPNASTSSKKRTQGFFSRAKSKYDASCFFAVADPHIKDIAEADVDKIGVDLPGGSPGQ